jgi:F-type H+-transporting ATPase subunit a
MPQNSTTSGPNSTLSGVSSYPLQIAQGGEPKQLAAGETQAETKTEEKAAPLGTVPDPGLLLYNAALVAIIMVVFGALAAKSVRKIPKGFSNFGEWVAEQLNTFTVGVIGPGGEKYTPLIGTIFLYILIMNLLGLIPFLSSSTSNVTTTLALGLFVFVYVQVTGIRSNGVGGYLMHFCGPKFESKLGNLPFAAPLMFPIEVISEIFRPLTLAVRLFGNIFGEDVILVALAGLGAGSIWSRYVPFHLPILLLALLTSLVQAMVFSTLACIYITLVSHHDDEHEHHGEDNYAETPTASETVPHATHSG